MGWKLKHTPPNDPDVLPYVEIPPVHTLDELMAFDRGVCERGCKRFVRDLTDADFPPPMAAELRQQGDTLIVVQELWPGARRRTLASGYVIKGRDLQPN